MLSLTFLRKTLIYEICKAMNMPATLTVKFQELLQQAFGGMIQQKIPFVMLEKKDEAISAINLKAFLKFGEDRFGVRQFSAKSQSREEA